MKAVLLVPWYYNWGWKAGEKGEIDRYEDLVPRQDETDGDFDGGVRSERRMEGEAIFRETERIKLLGSK